MDPNANLKRQRELAAEIIDGYGNRDASDIADLAAELAELVQALDEWRQNGGFDPYAQTEVEPKGDDVVLGAGEHDPRYYAMDLIAENVTDLADEVVAMREKRGRLLGLVDDVEGGIIAYVLGESLTTQLVTTLNRTGPLEGS